MDRVPAAVKKMPMIASMVAGYSSRPGSRKQWTGPAFRLGEALDWAVGQARAKGFSQVTVACEPTGPRWMQVQRLCAERGLPLACIQYVADQQNYYQQEKVHVAIRDGCAWDRERLRRTATIGLGRAVLSRLTDGTPWTVLCVNTDRPLFWLLARDAYASAGELKGHRIAIHPPHTMPGWFSRIVLRRLGLDPDHDIQPVVMTPGDYGRHLRRLAEGSLDAAFVGSTQAPEVTAREHGLRLLAFVGDYFQIPTVGVAVDPTHLAPDDPAVLALVRANRRALRTIRDEPDLAVRYVNALIPSLTQTEARRPATCPCDADITAPTPSASRESRGTRRVQPAADGAEPGHHASFGLGRG
jgi:NMT1/THI5 like